MPTFAQMANSLATLHGFEKRRLQEIEFLAFVHRTEPAPPDAFAGLRLLIEHLDQGARILRELAPFEAEIRERLASVNIPEKPGA